LFYEIYVYKYLQQIVLLALVVQPKQMANTVRRYNITIALLGFSKFVLKYNFCRY